MLSGKPRVTAIMADGEIDDSNNIAKQSGDPNVELKGVVISGNNTAKRPTAKENAAYIRKAFHLKKAFMEAKKHQFFQDVLVLEGADMPSNEEAKGTFSRDHAPEGRVSQIVKWLKDEKVTDISETGPQLITYEAWLMTRGGDNFLSGIVFAFYKGSFNHKTTLQYIHDVHGSRLVEEYNKKGELKDILEGQGKSVTPELIMQLAVYIDYYYHFLPNFKKVISCSLNGVFIDDNMASISDEFYPKTMAELKKLYVLRHKYTGIDDAAEVSKNNTTVFNKQCGKLPKILSAISERCKNTLAVSTGEHKQALEELIAGYQQALKAFEDLAQYELPAVYKTFPEYRLVQKALKTFLRSYIEKAYKEKILSQNEHADAMPPVDRISRMSGIVFIQMLFADLSAGLVHNGVFLLHWVVPTFEFEKFKDAKEGDRGAILQIKPEQTEGLHERIDTVLAKDFSRYISLAFSPLQDLPVEEPDRISVVEDSDADVEMSSSSSSGMSFSCR